MKNLNVGFAITGSFCTLSKILPVLEKISESNNVMPIFSYSVRDTDTRFYKAADIAYDVEMITGKKPIATIAEAEPIGPKNLLDLLIIAPCTGNTLTKLNHGITDTPVLMAAKATLRNNKPVIIAISTNDGLSGNARNFGDLINKKFIYFVPFGEDDPVKKPNSLVADFDLIFETAEAALNGRQLQPVIKG
jgi:dipicolinate synthase subunit B